MAIWYSIQLDCEPREMMADAELVGLLRRYTMARAVERHATGSNPAMDPAAMVYREKMATPSGEPVERETNVAAVRAEIEPLLDEFEPSCARCPAAAGAGVLGCMGALTLPLEEETEQWLAERLQRCSPEVAERLLLPHLPETPDPTIAAWRRARLFPFAQPCVTLGGKELDLDRLHSRLWLGGPITPEFAFALLLTTGSLRAGGTSDPVQVLLELNIRVANGRPPRGTLEHAIDQQDDDPPGVAEFKEFLFRLYVAMSLQCEVSIHV